MAYWLVKSEPFKYSWDRMVADGVTHWNGVRNHQASNNLKAMRLGDRAFFYHSNEGLEIVGVVEVAREYYPDPSDEAGRFGMVDVRAVAPVANPVTLKQMKADPELADMALNPPVPPVGLPGDRVAVEPYLPACRHRRECR